MSSAKREMTSLEEKMEKYLTEEAKTRVGKLLYLLSQYVWIRIDSSLSSYWLTELVSFLGIVDFGIVKLGYNKCWDG